MGNSRTLGPRSPKNFAPNCLFFIDMSRQLSYHDLRPRDFSEELADVNARRHPLALLFDGVADARNIGALFRLADAANVSRVFLYREPDFQINQKMVRVSRSTIEYVPFTVVKDENHLKEILSEYSPIVLDYTDRSTAYTKFSYPPNPLLVIGNEQRGTSDELMELVADHIHLPMLGVKTSMNVACAASIAVYHVLHVTSLPEL